MDRCYEFSPLNDTEDDNSNTVLQYSHAHAREWAGRWRARPLANLRRNSKSVPTTSMWTSGSDKRLISITKIQFFLTLGRFFLAALHPSSAKFYLERWSFFGLSSFCRWAYTSRQGRYTPRYTWQTSEVLNVGHERWLCQILDCMLQTTVSSGRVLAADLVAPRLGR